METKYKENKTFDMSSEAIDQRLRDVSQLFRLGISIKNVSYIGKAKDILLSPSSPKEITPEKLNESKDLENN